MSWLEERIRFLIWMWRNRYIWFLRAVPEELPLVIYEAQPGGGKTLSGVDDFIAAMRGGIRCASNLYIRDALTGQEAIICRTWLEMLRLTVDAVRDREPILFLFDEVHVLCDSRNWQQTPGWWLYLMSMHRHFGIGFIGTTQALPNVESRLRSLVGRIIRVRRRSVQGWVRTGGSRLLATSVMLWSSFQAADGRWLYLVPSVAFSFVVWVYLPVILQRLPLFRYIELNQALIDTPGASWETDMEYTRWMPWQAWHSYSTSAVIEAEDLKAYKDEELIAEIDKLSKEMAGLLEVVGLPAWQDEVYRLAREKEARRAAAA